VRHTSHVPGGREAGVRQTDHRLRAVQARLNDIELELTSNATGMLAETTSVEQRARLLVRTKQLVEERTTLAGEIKDLQTRRRTQEADLAVYQAEQVSKR
jgi:multidrug resistance efflux pump